jgi:hypothetical protein
VPDATDGPARHFFNEWAGLELLTAAVSGDHPPAARFYGAAAHLHTLLLGDDAVAAQEALIAFAAALGRMHTLTADRFDEYHRMRSALGPFDHRAGFFEYDSLAPAFRDIAATLYTPLHPGTDADLRLLRARLRDPGPFLTLIHADACPDNCLRVGNDMRLFDFEGSTFGHALIDGVYGRMHFPSCWCVSRLPEQLPLRMEAAYRVALVQGCPDGADDARFFAAVVEARAFWLIRTAQWTQLAELLERRQAVGSGDAAPASPAAYSCHGASDTGTRPPGGLRRDGGRHAPHAAPCGWRRRLTPPIIPPSPDSILFAGGVETNWEAPRWSRWSQVEQ